jgi:hypothetical protein
MRSKNLLDHSMRQLRDQAIKHHGGKPQFVRDSRSI